MTIDPDLALTATKYFTACGCVSAVAIAPAWLAEKTEKSDIVVARVRAASWLFGWTIVGYFYGLYLAAAADEKKK